MASNLHDKPEAPKKRRRSKETLRRFIDEALRAERLRQEEFDERFRGAPPTMGPGWPYWDGGTLGLQAWKELGSPQKSIQEIERRLKQFLYPYELGPKKERTFYQYAESRGALEALTTTPLLWHIRSFWWNQFYDDRVKNLRLEERSEYGHPLSFHRELLFLLSSHLAEIEKLTQQQGVEEGWLEEYRNAVLRQLLTEAAIYYPKVQQELTPAAQSALPSNKIEAQVALFDAIRSALQARRIDSEDFAYQLTALLCTSPSHIEDNELSPTPETVRSNIEWYQKHRGKPRK